MRTIFVLLWKDLMMAKRQKISIIYRMVFPLIPMLLGLYIASRTRTVKLSDEIELKDEKLLDDKTTAPRCILYTPNSKLAGILMDEVGKQLGLSRLTAMPRRSPCNGYYPYSNFSEVAELVKTFSGREAAVCIILEDMDAESWSSRHQKKLTYTIQMDGKFNTRSFTSAGLILPPGQPHYVEIYDDFVRIQKAIDTSYIKVHTKKDDPEKLQGIPKFHGQDSLMESWNEKMILCVIYFYVMVFSAMNLFTHIMARMCCERAAGIQELIKMNGVSHITLGLAYFISSLPPVLSFSIGCSIMFKIGDTPAIEYTSGIIIFISLALYAVSLLSFGMACSYVVKSSRFITVIAIFIYIATIVTIKYVVLIPPESWFLIVLCGIMVHVPILWIFREIYIFEFLKKPVTLTDSNARVYQGGSVLEAYICLILQSLMFFALAWYLSYVRPGHYGNPLPWNFLCKKKKDENEIIAAYREAPEERDDKYFEEPPKSKEVGIQITNVSKFYPKPALSDVTLDVYKGEITVLLGHNGAGKTTLISVITGMTPASEGKVLVNGMDTASNSLHIRKQIGLCTQHNLFIDRLNVIEHVMFFNMLKGKSENPRATSRELLKTLGIGNKVFANPEELSGGMKRRLQLACALAGGSDVLVLDEPTSGLDIETRRELWNLLLSLRGERTVLLSTHFMEEADALGDRVVALHTGHLRCHATPMYLKKAMGGGYRLSLVTSGKPKERKITDVVTQHVAGATVREELMNTITYNLPSSETPQFPALFAALETNRTALEISSIGVGVSTMEEVFLYLCSDSETFIKEETDTEVVPASEYGKIKGKNLYLRQAIVLFKRHLNFIRENIITFPVLQIIVPALLIYYISLICNTKEKTKDSPSPGTRTLMDRIYKPPERKALYSTVIRHAAVVALNLLSNVVPSQFVGVAKRALTDYDQPVEETADVQMPPASGAKELMPCGMWSILVCCVVLASSQNLQALPSREGASGARHLHMMAGCPAALHWLCTLTFHTTITLLTVVPIVIICAYVCDNDNTFRNSRFLFTLGLILVLGIIAFFGLTYFLVISYNGKTSTGLVIFCIIWSALFVVQKIFAGVLQVKLNPIEYMVMYLSNVLPPFAMMAGIGQATYVARLNTLCELHKSRCPKMLLIDPGFDEDKCCGDQLPKAYEDVVITPDILEDTPESAGESKAYISFGEYSPGVQMLIMLVQAIVFMTLVILIQMGYVSCICDRLFNKWFKSKPVVHVDDLVAAEATRVDQEIELPEQEIVDHNKAVLVSHLHKNYAGLCKSHHAVKGISFSVNKVAAIAKFNGNKEWCELQNKNNIFIRFVNSHKLGQVGWCECFGLLGLNGAGKSTTFKMITTEVCPTEGRIFANGFFLHKQKKEFVRKIGYCPQFLGIDDFQTGNDNLRTLLTIRGLDDKDIAKEMKAWIGVVGLEKYAKMRASSYSGGYKRRLAAAAALCSGAPLSLLDEPTAGVDVGARRLVHAALRKALSLGDSIVITSHSMDEMEALCTRIAVLAGGRIRALGTSAELRTKYAQGYALIFKIKPVDDKGKSQLEKLKVAVNVKFHCELKDEHMTMLHYHIKNKMDYSEIFSRLEDLRLLFPDMIEDYSVNETTLEEVFLLLAKQQGIEKRAAEAAALEANKNKNPPKQSGTSSKV